MSTRITRKPPILDKRPSGNQRGPALYTDIRPQTQPTGQATSNPAGITPTDTGFPKNREIRGITVSETSPGVFRILQPPVRKRTTQYLWDDDYIWDDNYLGQTETPPKTDTGDQPPSPQGEGGKATQVSGLTVRRHLSPEDTWVSPTSEVTSDPRPGMSKLGETKQYGPRTKGHLSTGARKEEPSHHRVKIIRGQGPHPNKSTPHRGHLSKDSNQETRTAFQETRAEFQQKTWTPRNESSRRNHPATANVPIRPPGQFEAPGQVRRKFNHGQSNVKPLKESQEIQKGHFNPLCQGTIATRGHIWAQPYTRGHPATREITFPGTNSPSPT